ncbi:MAG: MOSC domain-containing protein [Rhodospirillales bacterium]
MTETEAIECAVSALHRYPVKGLAGENLASVKLAPGAAVAGDRRFGLMINEAEGAAPRAEWTGWRSFAVLKTHTLPALLEARFDETSGVLTVLCEGRAAAQGNPSDPAGRAALEDFFAGFMKDELKGARPALVEASGVHFSDNGADQVSIINLASVRDLARTAGADIDVRRMRGNIIIDGAAPWAAPWAEREWIGREITIGPARLRVEDHIGRCAAVGVNPDTAKRDMNLVKALQHEFGHTDCGVYATVTAAGEITPGDEVRAV